MNSFLLVSECPGHLAGRIPHILGAAARSAEHPGRHTKAQAALHTALDYAVLSLPIARSYNDLDVINLDSRGFGVPFRTSFMLLFVPTCLLYTAVYLVTNRLALRLY